MQWTAWETATTVCQSVLTPSDSDLTFRCPLMAAKYLLPRTDSSFWLIVTYMCSHTSTCKIISESLLISNISQQPGIVDCYRLEKPLVRLTQGCKTSSIATWASLNLVGDTFSLQRRTLPFGVFSSYFLFSPLPPHSLTIQAMPYPLLHCNYLSYRWAL